MTDAVTEGQDAMSGAGEQTGTANQFGGYSSVEELVAAHAALKATQVEPTGNSGLTAKKEEEASAGAEDKGDESATTDEAAADALKAAGLDQTVFTKEFAETGTISAESFASLEKAGFQKDLVEVYLDGLKARQATYEASIFAPAGGKDGYTKLLQWAGKNLEDADIDAFNSAVTSGDAARAKLAVAGLAAQAKQGTPTLLTGKAGAADGVKPYASRAEVQEAIRNPKYRTDPAYRDAHMARLRVSSLY
ncbi:capsid assembly protein [Xanthomonas tesorieronis]|uniref:capsid assembly protein n=1 Tax=Xanthomonas tesorieronis TaxID=3160839 RepID=UPI003512BA96